VRCLPLALVGTALAGCASAAPPAPTKVAPPPAAKAAPPVEVAASEETVVDAPAVRFDDGFQSFGFPKCTYLAPRDGLVARDGGFDALVHFHAGQMSAKDVRASGFRGVFVACGYGVGTTGYARAFEDPRRFGLLLKRLTQTIARRTARTVHVRHLALASWSAGFAAVQRILGVDAWYQATDAVVLLDSLHARYTDDGEDAHVDPQRLRAFVRFAADAKAGKKTMVVTHSAIRPPGYASTTEATTALAEAIGAPVSPPDETLRRTPFRSAAPSARAATMDLVRVADDRDFHVRGFRGTGPHDHFDHLHLLGDALRSWVVPRWYTPNP